MVPFHGSLLLIFRGWAQADAEPDASDGADRSVLATAALANQWEAVPFVAVVVNSSYQTGVKTHQKRWCFLGNYGTPVGMEKGNVFVTFRCGGEYCLDQQLGFGVTFSFRFFGWFRFWRDDMLCWDAFSCGILGILWWVNGACLGFQVCTCYFDNTGLKSTFWAEFSVHP